MPLPIDRQILEDLLIPKMDLKDLQKHTLASSGRERDGCSDQIKINLDSNADLY